MARPRVVIVGAGFGGLTCAKKLARAPVEITVLDRANHHCFQPLLYQVATAALAPGQIAWPIRAILRQQQNATVFMAEIDGVDLQAKVVRAGARRFAFDYLVLATGAMHSYFGHDDWGRDAPGLKRIEDAIEIRRRLLTAFEAAELCDDEEERRRALTFVVVGAGPTGVELAGAIAEIARQSRHEFRRIDSASARVVLVEAGPRILPVYPETLSRYAERVLARKGVEVQLGAAVTDVTAHGVETTRGPIPARTVLWAAGVRASPAAAWLAAPADRSGRAEVAPDLSVPGRSDLFVIGDAAAVKQESGLAPGVAPAAKQMGAYVAKVIAARVAGRAPPKPFRYAHAGDLATIGRNAAVVKLDRLQLRGFVAWSFWSVAHVYFLISARSRIAVAFNWLWDYVTFQRGVRLITNTPRQPQ